MDGGEGRWHFVVSLSIMTVEKKTKFYFLFVCFYYDPIVKKVWINGPVMNPQIEDMILISML